MPLSIFDFRVSDEDNRLFVRNLKKNVGVPDPPRSLQGPIEASSLFTTNSSEFFKMLNIPLDFLDIDPTAWPDNADYQSARKVVSSLVVVNDHAERAIIKLMYRHLIGKSPQRRTSKI